jgi:hypothetical protein
MSNELIYLQKSTPIQLNAATSELRFGVVFGTPSKACEGSGVCMIASMELLHRWAIPCFFTVAFFSILEEGHFVFRIPVTSLNKGIRSRYFQNGIFGVEEAFSIPKWLVKVRGKPRIEIPPGIYRIEEIPGSLLIHFNWNSTN